MWPTISPCSGTKSTRNSTPRRPHRLQASTNHPDRDRRRRTPPAMRQRRPSRCGRQPNPIQELHQGLQRRVNLLPDSQSTTLAHISRIHHDCVIASLALESNPPFTCPAPLVAMHSLTLRDWFIRLVPLPLICALVMVTGVSAQWSTPHNGGDDVLGGLTTESPSPDQSQAFNDALSQVALSDPDMAAEIAAGLDSGAVTLVDIHNESDLTNFQHGAADNNTLGIELGYKNATEIAGTLVHEWTHLRQRNLDSSFNSVASGASLECREASAYAMQIMELCELMCEFELYPDCDEWKRVNDAYYCYEFWCISNGGICGPPAPIECDCSPPGC